MKMIMKKHNKKKKHFVYNKIESLLTYKNMNIIIIKNYY